MPRRLFIPPQVIESIREHINVAVQKGVDGFWSANEDEDTLTGHLGANLRTGVHAVRIEPGPGVEVAGTWTWSIDYAKFRGRGKDATEKRIGADGIIELSVTTGAATRTKSLLFQSKTQWNNEPELVEQALLLSTWREAALAVDYTPSGFNAYSLDAVLRSRGKQADAGSGVTLQRALGEYFLECKVGNTTLSYDSRSRKLAWRDTLGKKVATQFAIPHRLRIKVKAPPYKDKFRYDELIDNSSIHMHRMEVEQEDILMPLLEDKTETLTKRRNALSLAYHPDSYDAFEQFLKDIANRRMQEINDTFAASRKKEKRNKKTP